MTFTPPLDFDFFRIACTSSESTPYPKLSSVVTGTLQMSCRRSRGCCISTQPMLPARRRYGRKVWSPKSGSAASDASIRDRIFFARVRLDQRPLEDS
eukprot:scaffold97_cov261-Pinguiococcus_pyrenoidosus.AAC.7